MKRSAFDKAPDLVDYVRLAQKIGHPVDPILLDFLKRLRPGRQRRALQKPGMRGKRGAGLGDHRQLYLAREMWKHVHLAGLKVQAAAARVANGSSSAIRAYYRFGRGEPRTLYVELSRDLGEDQDSWRALAKDEDTAREALEALQDLRRLHDLRRK